MTDRDPLDDYFRALRAEKAEPSPELLRRIVADAAAEAARQEAPAPGSRPAGQASARRPLRALLVGIGGWPGVAGLATATLAGIWIGVTDPLDFDPLSLAGPSLSIDAALTEDAQSLDWVGG